MALLKQIKGVGTLIALTFLLTLEDPHRFRKSRDVGCYLGLQPGRRNSGQSEPQMHISKEGDPYLRTLLVQGAQHILGPFGSDCDLRRWGLKLAERGGKSGKKRAIIATAQKAGGVAASPVGEWRSVRTVAQQQPMSDAGGRIKPKSFFERKNQSLKPSSGDCVNRLAQLSSVEMERKVDNQVAAPAETRTPNLHRAKQIAHRRVRMEGWRQWRLGWEETP